MARAWKSCLPFPVTNSSFIPNSWPLMPYFSRYRRPSILIPAPLALTEILGPCALFCSHFAKIPGQSPGQPPSQSPGQSLSQSLSLRSVSKSVSKSPGQPPSQSPGQSLSQSLSLRSVSKSVSGSVSKSPSQSFSFVLLVFWLNLIHIHQVGLTIFYLPSS